MFYVKTTRNNGYRCGCCIQTWTNTEKYEDREGALAQFPLTIQDEEFNEIEAMEIEDGSTGETIAWGRIEDTSGHYAYSCYTYMRWVGFHPDHGDVEHIKGNGDPTGKTWEECVAEVKAKGDKEKRRKAEAKLKEAQATLSALGASPQEG